MDAMRQADRATFDRALRRARLAAFPPGEFVGQESFMRASEIRSLASDARIGPGTSVLDLCCGVAGPGRYLAAELGCGYLGVDRSAEAIAIARGRAGGLACRFAVSAIPPVPGRFDVVLLLETMLAFPDKPALLAGVRATLRPGGRFAFTLEEGQPLSAAERERMPASDTVWLTPLPDLLADLGRVGLRVCHQVDCTQPQLAMVDALRGAFADDAADIEAQIGSRALDDLLAAHRIWGDWMRDGRVRKFAITAQG